MGISRDRERCRKCRHRKECKNKQMEACAFAEQSSNYAADLMVKHNYRNVLIAENTTVTIDLEEVKERIKDEIVKNLNTAICQSLGGDKIGRN